MHGPKPRGYWSSVRSQNSGSSYQFLEQGNQYCVVKQFADFDGDVHPVNETWTFRGYSFLPYEDGLSLFVSLDGDEEWLVRLQDRSGAQAAVVADLNEYLAPLPELQRTLSEHNPHVNSIIPHEKLHLVRELLAQYLDKPWTPAGDYRVFARENSAIPLFENWTNVTFLRVDGYFISLDTEDQPGSVTPEADVKWQLAALSYGAERNPKIRALLPARPLNADTCSFCGGAGWIDLVNASARVVCGECGGVGWRT